MHHVGTRPKSKIRKISIRRGLSCTTTTGYMQRYRLFVHQRYDQKILWRFSGFTTACAIWWYLFRTFSKRTSIYAGQLKINSYQLFDIFIENRFSFNSFLSINLILAINKWFQLWQIRAAESMWIQGKCFHASAWGEIPKSHSKHHSITSWSSCKMLKTCGIVSNQTKNKYLLNIYTAKYLWHKIYATP